MNKLYALLFLLHAVAFSQAPAIEWQRTLGGNNFDVPKSVLQHNDKYIIAGFSNSPISGDKTVFNGSTFLNDIWAIGLSSSGSIEWQKAYPHSLVEGNAIHSPNASFHFFDSKFYFGTTYNDWDVFQSRIHHFDDTGLNYSALNPGEDTNCGAFSLTSYEDVIFTDYFKTTSTNYFFSGTKGNLFFGCPNIIPTGSYFISLSSSTNYNTVIWSTEYAGSNYDELTSTIETNDGGFLLSGFSNSNVSGDKTENSLGGYDYWIIKTNSEGNILWQNTIGGNATDQPIKAIQTIDNGFLIAGSSNSNASGDKTENSKGGSDYWLVKLDSSGSVQWNKTLGGNLDDNLSKIIETVDGNYLLVGNSKSSISGDKNENCRGETDTWIVKINTLGSIIWQKTIGGNLNDNAHDVIQTIDQGFLVICSSDSTISGEKSENNRGNSDYWILKLGPDNLSNFENQLFSNIQIYPNPTNGIVNINFGSVHEDVSISILNLLGQVVSTAHFHQITEKQIQIEGQSGVYFLEIVFKDFSKKAVKIIKN